MNREISSQPRRRLITLVVGISIFMVVLAGRVYSIQIIQGPVYEAMATAQQRVALSGVDSRGEICDRNGEPLTGTKLEYVYIMRKDRVEERAGKLKPGVQSLIRQLGGRERRTSNDKYRIVTAGKYQKEAAERLRTEYGAYVLQIPQRYEADQTAVYLLGYVRDSDGVGVSGLERAFDDWLSQRDKVIYGVADASNRILTGYGVQNREDRFCRLITTLDKSLQEELERITNCVEEGRCCIIVTEVESGDLLGCAVAPGFDPLMVEELVKSEGEELLDIALQGQYPPGSVFKIVVAAAALEAGICEPETSFFCSGSEFLDDVEICCSVEDGHGTLTMEEVFAKSCNCAFIQMGQRVGADAILNMAENLGLGREVLKDLDMEKPGNLPEDEETVGPGIGNVSIGQGSLLVTPLQVAQLTQIVANGGVDTGLYLAAALEDESGVRKLPRDNAAAAVDFNVGGTINRRSTELPRRVMSSETAKQILRMMRATTEYGTARSLNDWDCGGKTGSAEGVINGEPAVHAWFTGVVPTEDPQFTVTVFVEGGGSGGRTAVPVFEQVLEVLE